MLNEKYLKHFKMTAFLHLASCKIFLNEIIKIKIIIKIFSYQLI